MRRELITPTEQGIASRVQAGSVALFAFDTGQELSEHTSRLEALVLVLAGDLGLQIGGDSATAAPGTVVRMPANVPHAVHALAPLRMLLIRLRDTR